MTLTCRSAGGRAARGDPRRRPCPRRRSPGGRAAVAGRPRRGATRAPRRPQSMPRTSTPPGRRRSRRRPSRRGAGRCARISAREPGISISRPKMSVTKPGVSSSAPPKITSAPSAVSRRGHAAGRRASRGSAARTGGPGGAAGTRRGSSRAISSAIVGHGADQLADLDDRPQLDDRDEDEEQDEEQHGPSGYAPGGAGVTRRWRARAPRRRARPGRRCSPTISISVWIVRRRAATCASTRPAWRSRRATIARSTISDASANDSSLRSTTRSLVDRERARQGRSAQALRRAILIPTTPQDRWVVRQRDDAAHRSARAPTLRTIVAGSA